jgi:hypothetical protein
MNFPIIDEDGKTQDIRLSFDMYGNLYFNDLQISVNNKNHLVAEAGDYYVLEKNIDTNFKKLHMFDKNNRLKKKVLKTINEPHTEELDDDDPENPYEIEDEDHYVDSGDDEPELVVDEEKSRQYGDDNKPFTFSTSVGIENLVNDRNNGDICALYDTYIYRDNNLSVKSTSSDNSSIYRIKCYSDGAVFCRLTTDVDVRFYPKLLKTGEIIFSV